MYFFSIIINFGVIEVQMLGDGENWTYQTFWVEQRMVSIYYFKHFTSLRAWGPFLESPGNFSGPKSNIQIENIKNKSTGPG